MAKDERIKQQFQEIKAMLDNVVEDSTIPKNIRKGVIIARERMDIEDEPIIVLTKTLYGVERVMGDMNMPFHTRTELLSILSELERFREEVKKTLQREEGKKSKKDCGP